MISLFSFGEYKFVSGSIDYHYILYVHCLNGSKYKQIKHKLCLILFFLLRNNYLCIIQKEI